MGFHLQPESHQVLDYQEPTRKKKISVINKPIGGRNDIEQQREKCKRKKNAGKRRSQTWRLLISCL